jgi:hypothetical protein
MTRYALPTYFQVIPMRQPGSGDGGSHQHFNTKFPQSIFFRDYPKQIIHALTTVFDTGREKPDLLERSCNALSEKTGIE